MSFPRFRSSQPVLEVGIKIVKTGHQRVCEYEKAKGRDRERQKDRQTEDKELKSKMENVLDREETRILRELFVPLSRERMT